MRFRVFILTLMAIAILMGTARAQEAENDTSRYYIPRSDSARIDTTISDTAMSETTWRVIPRGDTAETSRRKPNPTGALLRSAFVPGWGQLYNKKYIKAGVFAIGEGYLIYGIASDWSNANNHEAALKNTTDQAIKAEEFNAFEKYRDRRNVKMWILTAAILYSMFDAYVDAQLADFDETDKAYEVFLSPVSDDGLLVGMILRF